MNTELEAVVGGSDAVSIWPKVVNFWLEALKCVPEVMLNGPKAVT